MLTLRVNMTLSCAHKLVECVALQSKCRRLHGHTYYVEVFVQGNSTGNLLVDADVVKGVVMEAFDHRYLNDQFEELGIKGETTLENFARAIKGVVEDICPGNSWVQEVTVQEGDGATVRLEEEE